MTVRVSIIAGIAATVASCLPAAGSELLYHPVSPTFGGNPLNGSYLLSQAQAQGLGTKSGSQGPDLSGLSDALKNIGAGAGSVVVVGGSGNGGQNNIPPNP